jgi:hypothetical protein
MNIEEYDIDLYVDPEEDWDLSDLSPEWSDYMTELQSYLSESDMTLQEFYDSIENDLHSQEQETTFKPNLNTIYYKHQMVSAENLHYPLNADVINRIWEYFCENDYVAHSVMGIPSQIVVREHIGYEEIYVSFFRYLFRAFLKLQRWEKQIYFVLGQEENNFMLRMTGGVVEAFIINVQDKYKDDYKMLTTFSHN